MMRSLFSGVSGLKNHQTRMDVIGNNIANVNTPGFKASRVSFQDVLSQTIQGASAAQGNRGGTNPVQIGLGVGVASIDTIFTDGSYQSTGKMTDLAVTGKNLFILNDGTQEYYTRAGNFDFDGSGIYGVTGTGLKVMGWMANAAGEINATGSLTAIQIPEGTSMPPKVSTEINIANNLSSDGKGKAAGIASADAYMTFAGSLDANAEVGKVVSFQVQTYLASGAQVPVTVNFKKTGDPGTNTWSITTGENTVGGQSYTVGTTPSPITLSIGNGTGGTMNVEVDTSAISANSTNALTGIASAGTTVKNGAIMLNGVVPGEAAAGTTVNLNATVMNKNGINETVPVVLTKTANANEWSVAMTTTAPNTMTLGSTTFKIPATEPLSITGAGSRTNVKSLVVSGITTGTLTGTASASTGVASNKIALSGVVSSQATTGETLETTVKVIDSAGKSVNVPITLTKTANADEWAVTSTATDKITIPTPNTILTGASPTTLTLTGVGTVANSITLDVSGIKTNGTVAGTTGTTTTDTELTISGVVSADAVETEKVETSVQVIDKNGNRVDVPITLTKTANADEWKVTTTSSMITIPANTTFTIPATTSIAVTPTAGTVLENITSLNVQGITTGKADTANAALAVYDSLGAAHKVEYTYTKTNVPGEWTVSAKVDGNNVEVTNNKIAFNSEGVLISPTSSNSGPQITVPGSAGATNFPLTMNLFSEDGTPALTQRSGKSTIFATKTDGYAAGTLQNVVANSSGELIGTFSNERTMTLAKVALATFSNPGGLEKSGQNYYVKSANSGERRIVSDGAFAAGSLEGSNVDLAEQFSDMIITQRGFQANSKDITTADEMLEIIANLKR